ncbi:Transglutaminase-like superfamily protein [Jatrophihabitans endophyticus]|uniref:Transglutaminase-like superfamily protein n=1 Tax=Jatrophihabitans endophyticus TaxID=1206085 RepID=A0A1M5PFZ7_9ACTN|nr:transglutaminase-like domain-containing protein [Jatrophihabitans endophyticus]SHH00734.1 Transglutaminase-like superfamily protein [Jatrophihabitans endophyticus]
MNTRLRRSLPLLVLPLALVLCVLASAPWLRAFPADVMAVPLVGTALISVLLPVVVVAIGVRTLWLTALVDLAGFVFFTTLVTLREPFGFSSLWDGLVHGPSQILTFALPLVSPRTLLVAPIALCWLCGAIIGECLGRGWPTLVPSATALVTFGLAYAATTRAITDADDGRCYDTLLAGALLATLLVLRAVQAWLDQDASTSAANAVAQGQQAPRSAPSLTGLPVATDRVVLPLRTLAAGAGVAVAVAAVAALVVQSSAFSGSPASAERLPPVERSGPLTPVAFVAGLRPTDPRARAHRLFGVSFEETASRYVAIADTDVYDGDAWAFEREFRPSGGVVPADTDPSLRPKGGSVAQRYTIDAGPLAGAPWLPFQYRPQDVSGVPIATEPTSGMIVPGEPLRAGQSYTVMSATPRGSFESLPRSATPGTSAPPADTALPPSVRRSLGTVLTSLQNETKTRGASAVTFLRALVRDLRTHYSLSGGPASTAPSAGTSATAPASTTPAPTRSTSTNPSTGGTAFAGVLASILGPTRSATPEQYATLVTLLARAQGVPARLVSGFRLGSGTGDTVPAGTYDVTDKQAWTWVEIPIAGRGWVVLDATPSTYSNQRPAPSVSARPTPSPSPSSTPNALATQAPSDNGNAVAPRSDVPGSRGPSAGWWLIAVVVVAVLLLLVPVALLLRKQLRLRRRRRGAPREQVIGAWQETLDVLAESGLGDATSFTSAEVGEATARRFDGETAARTRAVGDAANRAIFDPASTVGVAEADAAWREHADLRRRVRHAQTLRQRVGSGLRYHRVRTGAAVAGPASWAESMAQRRESRRRPRRTRRGRHRRH